MKPEIRLIHSGKIINTGDIPTVDFSDIEPESFWKPETSATFTIDAQAGQALLDAIRSEPITKKSEIIFTTKQKDKTARVHKKKRIDKKWKKRGIYRTKRKKYHVLEIVNTNEDRGEKEADRKTWDIIAKYRI